MLSNRRTSEGRQKIIHSDNSDKRLGGQRFLLTEHGSVVDNEDEGGISSGPLPSAPESSWIDKMFMERKKYDRTLQVLTE